MTKKIILGIAVLGFIFTSAPIFGQQSFPFKSGIVEYQETTLYGKKSTHILFVDGDKTALEKYRNGKLYEITISNDEYSYLIIPNEKKGKRNRITVESRELMNMYLDEKSWAKNAIGKEKILGKECDVYQFVAKYTNKKIWRWEDLVLKEETIGEDGKINYSKIATNIRIDVPIPKEQFQVPAGITIKEIENWEDEQEWLKENRKRQREDVPKNVRKEMESSSQYKALEKLSDLGEQWGQIPKEKRTEEVEKKFEEEMKESYKTLGLDINESIRRVRHKVNEQTAFSTLRSIDLACKAYKDIGGYYPPDLKTLTVPDPVPYISAEWIDSKKHGYNFIYALTSKSYTIIVNPATPGVTGTKRYFLGV